MASEIINRDQNHVTVLAGVTDNSAQDIKMLRIDPSSKRLLVSATGLPGGGTVTSVSVVTANGFSGTVATATSTPAITLATTVTGILKGNGTAISAATDGTDYLSPTTGVTISQSTPQTVGTTSSRVTKIWATDLTVTNAISGSITGNAATVTTNANLTGVITSSGNITSTGAQTGLGSTFVMSQSPTLASPALGVATATTINGLTITTNVGGVLTITSGKTLSASNTLTLAGTDSTVMTFPSTSATIARTDAANTFTGIQTMTSPVINTGLELGNASDTTLTRVSAGVIAVEGVTVPTISSTNTLTNKRITRRVVTVNAPGATPTTNTDNCDIAAFTGLATAITSMTTNLSGTPVAGDYLMFQFTDNGTARAITWGASFTSTTVTLPTTTVISTLLRVGFQWNGSVWQCIATA